MRGRLHDRLRGIGRTRQKKCVVQSVVEFYLEEEDDIERNGDGENSDSDEDEGPWYYGTA